MLIEDVRAALQNHSVTIEEQASAIIVKPNHYLPPDSFNEIFNIIRRFNGKYVPKSKSETGQPYWTINKINPKELLKQIIQQLTDLEASM